MIINNRNQFVWAAVAFALAVVAVVVRVCVAPAETERLAAGGAVGLCYGIAGGATVLLALSLSFLRFVPRWWWIGSRALWLKVHIWFGALGFVLILCHTGPRLGGTFECVLYAAYGLVVATGLFGLALQQFLPRWMTLEVPCEVPFEQIPTVSAALRDKADQQMHLYCHGSPPATRARIRLWYDEVIRSFLAWPFDRTHLLNDAGKSDRTFAELCALPGVNDADSKVPELLTRLQSYCDDRRRLARQVQLHRLLHGWLYVHIPLAWVMTVMMLVHAFMTGLYYHQ